MVHRNSKKSLESNGNAPGRTAVIGGGVAGLTAALYLARAGRQVTLFERSTDVGGRARSKQRNGFVMNLGPHALYKDGAARRILEELNIDWSGKLPGIAGSRFIQSGELYDLPYSAPTILMNGRMSLHDKWGILKSYAAIFRDNPEQRRFESFRTWVERRTASPVARAFLEGIARLSTYAADMDVLSADAAIKQMRMAAGGVYYVDHGWQSFVENLRAAVVAAGVELREGTGIAALRRSVDGGFVLSGDGDDGRAYGAASVIFACAPSVIARILRAGDLPVPSAFDDLVPARLASLDLGLLKLSERTAVTLDFDRNLYFSVHSYAARLQPEGRIMLHAAKYLSHAEGGDAAAWRGEIEDLMDRLAPGWRDDVEAEQFLPKMTVSHGLPDYRRGGLAGRPAVVWDEVPGIFFAGDWAGDEGMLADAACASARAAAGAVLSSAHEKLVA